MLPILHKKYDILTHSVSQKDAYTMLMYVMAVCIHFFGTFYTHRPILKIVRDVQSWLLHTISSISYKVLPTLLQSYLILRYCKILLWRWAGQYVVTKTGYLINIHLTNIVTVKIFKNCLYSLYICIAQKLIKGLII